jgi:3-methyladenine DNA glycosylase AlkD
MTIRDIENRLTKLAVGNEEYCKFNSRTINDTSVKYLGVRIPDLRKVAKELAKEDYWQLLQTNDWSIYEHKQIAFLLPSYLTKLDFEDFFAVIDFIIPFASSWANTDSLGVKLKYDHNQLRAKLDKYLSSNNGWEVRVGLNLMFSNLIGGSDFETSLKSIEKVDKRYHEKSPRGTLSYYVKMMLAWTLAEIAVKHREQVEVLLPRLDSETAKYTRQKMRDSFRIK